jgi:hypothetical protein
VSAPTGPASKPPTARFRIKKKGWLNTHGFGAASAGVALWYRRPSTNQSMRLGCHSTAKVWKALNTPVPKSWPPVMDRPPE